MKASDHPNNSPGVPMKFPPWFENFQIKYINPVAVPIARVVPGITVIKHRGRTSGRDFETAVSAYRKGNTVAIMLAHGKTNWVKNILAAGEAEIRRGAHTFGAGPRRRFGYVTSTGCSESPGRSIHADLVTDRRDDDQRAAGAAERGTGWRSRRRRNRRRGGSLGKGCPGHHWKGPYV